MLVRAWHITQTARKRGVERIVADCLVALANWMRGMVGIRNRMPLWPLLKVAVVAEIHRYSVAWCDTIYNKENKNGLKYLSD